jgi:hypothetical protein
MQIRPKENYALSEIRQEGLTYNGLTNKIELVMTTQSFLSQGDHQCD